MSACGQRWIIIIIMYAWIVLTSGCVKIDYYIWQCMLPGDDLCTIPFSLIHEVSLSSLLKSLIWKFSEKQFLRWMAIMLPQTKWWSTCVCCFYTHTCLYSLFVCVPCLRVFIKYKFNWSKYLLLLYMPAMLNHHTLSVCELNGELLPSLVYLYRKKTNNYIMETIKPKSREIIMRVEAAKGYSFIVWVNSWIVILALCIFFLSALSMFPSISFRYILIAPAAFVHCCW